MELGWDFSYSIDEVSLVEIMLIIRQQLMDIDGVSQMSLRGKDMLERKDISWEELVRESQRKAIEYMRKIEGC